MKSIVRALLAALGALSALWTQSAALLIDGGARMDDALALLQGGARQELAQPPVLKHTLRCGRWPAAPAAAQYLVDGSLAKGRGKGVGYHFSKSLRDRDVRTLAHWGTVVPGVDQGDGWLRVGECYLPMWLDGKQVVRPAPRPEAPRAALPPAAGAESAKAAPPPDAAPFLAGDAVEMFSPKAQKWYAVVVNGSGAQAGTYRVRLPMAAPGHRVLPAVPAASLRRAPEPAQSFAAGEGAEFQAGSAASTWTACVVEGRGRLPGTYTIRVAAAGTPQGGGQVFAIPGGWLRKREPGPGAGPPAAKGPGGPPPRGSAPPPGSASLRRVEDGDIALVLRRLHSSYAQIQELLEGKAPLPAS